MRRRLLFAALLFAVSFAGAPAAQQPSQSAAPPATPPAAPPAGQEAQAPAVTFKIDVNYVEVDATVTDDKGNFLKGLTKDDFEVLEDGKPQKIDLFTQVDIPIEPPERLLTASGGKPLTPDVASNDRPANGRLYVIALDDLHTAALRSSLVKRAARLFIEKNFAANDTAAIVYTSGRSDASQEFTSNPQLLLASIDKFIGKKLRSSTLEKLDTYNRQKDMDAGAGSSDGSSSSSSSLTGSNSNSNGDSLDFERGYYARMALSSLRNLANYMTNIRGRRKALLYFSEGIDYPIFDIFTARDATTIVQETRDAITAAARGNVSFYTIDPRGLVGTPDETMDLNSMPEDNNLRLNQQGLMDELRLSQDSLRTLAEETGGLAFVNSNDFATAYDKIVKANSSYYLIGYYPQENRRDGRFHKLQVKVKRPGAHVTARKGFSIPKVKPPDTREKGGDVQTSQELRDTLNSPLQQSGLTMAIHAASFKGTGKNASVALAIEMAGDRLQFKQEKDRHVDTVELVFFPIGENGKPIGGSRTEFGLPLTQKTYEMVRAFGLRANPRLDLPPGRYQLRVGAREKNAGELGSVFYDLVVPDFTKEKLSMSNILVTAATAQVTPTPMPDKQLQGIMPGPAMARREFVKGDVLAAYAEVYDNLPPTPSHTIDITTSVVTLEGTSVFKAAEERSSTELQGVKGNGYGHVTQIPLKDVAPGRYLLRIEAKSRLKDAQLVTRELPFSVLAPRYPQQAPPPEQPPATATPKKPEGSTPPDGSHE
jgi:VWFA-related protein